MHSSTNQGRLSVVRRAATLALLAATLLVVSCQRRPDAAPAATDTSASQIHVLALRNLLQGYRAIIVLLADEKSLVVREGEAVNQVAQAVFHENLEKQRELSSALAALLNSKGTGKYATLEAMLDYVESGEGLFDADRLAFREPLVDLQRLLAGDGTLQAIKLHKRVADDLEALTQIEHNYDEELRQIFNRFGSRAIELKRERWEDYVAKLRELRSREQVLRDYGVIVPHPVTEESDAAKAPQRKEGREQFGLSLPPKTVLLTFDDGPHGIYTEEIAAILKQYDAPAVFFQVGRNLGRVDAEGQVKLGPLAAVSRKLHEEGYAVGNHSFSHAQLAKLSGDALQTEIRSTDALLHALDPGRAPLFRFPYGAHSAEGLDTVEALNLHSIMWNVDSLDWADPVPNSIVDRVVSGVERAEHGIVLFHDIHERTVRALPKILERLTADGFRFAGWDGAAFSTPRDAGPVIEKTAVTSGYASSWAVVIGIDDYAHWPKLLYAANDAEAIRAELVQQYGFADDHVLVLKNEQATRNGILSLFESRLAHSVQRDDRLLVFFAGHGATRKLSSGRTLGYIIPVDSDPEQFAADAVPMTEIQDIAESLVAKHILFVMDACYSGLGLTRGGASRSRNFLNDNARRIGRQMLTAGGADQLVADGGPGGHSVFTWALLQALGGKGDLNGDGVITATELASYVAPAVAGMSHQTPAFGSLPGSEGGEFILELPVQTEFLNAQTPQLAADAIRLNEKLDAAAGANVAGGSVTVHDLQGAEHQVEMPKAIAVGSRRLAQLANDRGLQLFREQQYAAAEAQFTEALRQRPDFAQAANNLGFVYYRQEKYREAARWYENATRTDPSRAVAYLNLGDAYAHDIDKIKAKSAYETYLALVPTGTVADEVRRKLSGL